MVFHDLYNTSLPISLVRPCINLPSGVPNTEFMLIVSNLYKRSFAICFKAPKLECKSHFTFLFSRLLLINFTLLANCRTMLGTVLFISLFEMKLMAPTFSASLIFLLHAD